MSTSKQAFGQILHADLLGARPGFVVPEALDATLLHPAAETKFLSDKVKVALGLPLTHRPRMALVDDALFKEYLAKMVDSAAKLDELMAEYEELENSTPGVNRDRLHATVQQSVQLISHVKSATVHVALEGVGRWLKKQAFELERTQSELDTFEDADICVAQVDNDKEHQEQDPNSPRVDFKDGNASPHGGAAVKQRNVAAMKRHQTAARQQTAAGTPKAGTARAGATKAGAVSPQVPTPTAASPFSAALSTPLDVSVVQDTDAWESSATTATPGPIHGGVFSPQAATLGDTGPGASVGGGKSPGGKKQPQEHPVPSVSQPASECEVAEVKELRGTVAKQTQQLEQVNVKLKQAEVNAANARARMADLEACMAKEGIAVPPSSVAAADNAAAASSLSPRQAKVGKSLRPGRNRLVAASQASFTSVDNGAADSNAFDSEAASGTTPQADKRGGGQAAQTDARVAAGGMRQGKAQGSVKSRQGQPRAVAPVGSNGSRSMAGKGGSVLTSKGNEESGGTPEAQAAMEMPARDTDTYEDFGDEDDGGVDGGDAIGDMAQSEERYAGRRRIAGVADRKSGAGPVAPADVNRQLSELQKALLERDQLIASMQQDMDEMSQALGMTIATVERPAIEGASPTTSLSSAPSTMPEGSPLSSPQPVSSGNRSNLPAKAAKSNGPFAGLQVTSRQKPSMQAASGIAGATYMKEHAQDSQEGMMKEGNSSAAHQWSQETSGGSSPIDLAADSAPIAGGKDNLAGSAYAAASGAAAARAVSSAGASRMSLGSNLAHAPVRVRTIRTRVQAPSLTPADTDVVVEGLCPRCAELEKQLRYWRERSWFKKARDTRWALLRASREEIPVSSRKFKGVLKMSDETESAGSLLGSRRTGTSRQALSAGLSRSASRRSIVRGRSFVGGAQDFPELASLGSLRAQQIVVDPMLQLPLNTSSTGKGQAVSSSPGDQPCRGPGVTGGVSLQDHSCSIACSGSGGAEGLVGGSGNTPGPFRQTTRQTRNLMSTTVASRAGSPLEQQPGNGTQGLDTVEAGQRVKSQTLMKSVRETPTQGAGGNPNSVGKTGIFDQAADSIHAIDTQDTLDVDAALRHGGPGTAAIVPGTSATTSGSLCLAVGADGKGTVSFAGCDSPVVSAHGPGSLLSTTLEHQSAAQSRIAGHQSSNVPSVSGHMSGDQYRQLNGDSEGVQPCKNALERSGTQSASTGVPELKQNGNDARFEEHWDGVARSRVSAGSRASGGKLRIGSAGAFGVQEQAETPSPGKPLMIGSGRSSSPERRSAGQRLARPAARVKVEQKVDLASLALQGKSANSESSDAQINRRATDSHGQKTHQRSGSAGHLSNRHQIQHKPGTQVRSLKLFGAGINHAKSSEERPEAHR